MKTYTKKYMALLLAAVMMLTVLPFSVFAIGAAPTIISITPSDTSERYHQNMEVTFTVKTEGGATGFNFGVPEGVKATGDPQSNQIQVMVEKAGDYNITVKAVSDAGESEPKTIHLKVEPGRLTVDPASSTLEQGGTQKLTVADENRAPVEGARLEMTDAGDNVKVNGLDITIPDNAQPGTYLGKVSAENYEPHDITVTVKEKPVEKSITVNYDSVTMNTGEEKQLQATLTPTDDNATVTYEVKDGKTGISVTNGLIKATEAGDYTVVVKAAGYPDKEVPVKVNPKWTDIKSITVNPKSVTMKVEESKTLETTLAPNPDNIKPTYEVKDAKTGITVSNTGEIKAVEQGEYVVIVKAEGFGSKEVKVKVEPKETPTPPAKEEYTVKFVSNGGSLVDPQKTKDQKLQTLPTPVRAGFTFVGWYTDTDYSTLVTKDTKFTANTIVYAKWAEVTDKVTLRGVTWDSDGVKGYTNVPNATVVLYRYSDNSEVARTTSDSNGYFNIKTDFFGRYWYDNNYWYNNGYYYNGHTYREAKEFYDDYGYWPSWWRDDYRYSYSYSYGEYGYLIGYKTGYANSDREYVGNRYWNNGWWDGNYWTDRDERRGDYRIYPTSIERGTYWVSGYTNFKNTPVYVYDGNTYLGSATTDRDGYFKLSWNSPAISTSRDLQYYINEKYWKDNGEYSLVPVVTLAEPGTRTVKGKAGSYAKVEIWDKSGVKLGEGTVDSNGNFTITTSRNLISGETLRITALENYKKLSTASYIVKGATVTTTLAPQNRAYIKGYPDGTFRPQGNVTRAEAAQMVATLLNGGTNFGTSNKTAFKDANNGWYSAAINYVTEKGLIKGFEDGTFRPNQNITRAEFAQMISGYLQRGYAGTGVFKDVKGHWAQDAIDKVYGNKNVAGYPDGTFKPNREITRAEAVTVLNSVFNRQASASTIANNGAKTFSDVKTSFWAYYQILDAANGHLGN